MSEVILQILSVTGIILLVLLGLAAALLLLILFFPVSYRVVGQKDSETFSLAIRARWLFGLVRLRGDYPEPGRVTIRLLWHTLYDSGVNKTEKGPEKAAEEQSAGPDRQAHEKTSDPDLSKGTADAGEDAGKPPQKEKETGRKEQSEPSGSDESEEKSSWISKKIAKIKFTICSTYDKIKKIWQNISYYVNLLREDETKLLFSHTLRRLMKILKSIRPRKLTANVLFGTGAPDTTGYAFGIYGMFCALLGPGVVVTPDFERAVLEGRIDAAGRMTSAVLLWHLARVLLDRKLWKFVDKLKKGSASEKSSASGGAGKDAGKKTEGVGPKKKDKKDHDTQ